MESRWTTITLSTTKQGVVAQKFTEDWSIETEVYVSSIYFLHARRRDDKATIRHLRSLCSLNLLAVKDIASLSDVKTSIRRENLRFVSVYDVGQGNANAVCTEDSRPHLYFDLGGGCLQNRKTYQTLKRFCISSRPVVFLSHWDFDHYFSATQVPSLQKLTWIVPDQQVGPQGFKFAHRVAQSGKLILWPEIPTITNGIISVIQCTGKRRNDSGLALVVTLGKGRHRRNTLLPGDCRYRHIPGLSQFKLGGLIACHHGGDIGTRPQIPVTQNGLIAYSFGVHNTFGHPSRGTQTLYRKHGWQNARETPQGNIAVENIKKTPALACGGRKCDLVIRQIY